jgi:LysR family transcriptional regulator, low CO2-responsive transcriptional regulator
MENQLHDGLKSIIWQSITLHQLQVFEATARHCSFTRAAEELHLKQPTVSMQVKQLAKVIGTPLFENIGKRVYLTEVGKILFKTCQEIFVRIEQSEMHLLELKGLNYGALRLSATPTSRYFLTKMLNLFCQDYPDIHSSLEWTNHDAVIHRLDKDLDDLYVVSRLPERTDIESHPFLCNPLVVVASAQHPFACEEKLTLHDIAKETLIMREQNSATRKAVEQLFQQHQIPLRVKLEMSSNEAIKQAVSQGLGISVLSLHSLTDLGATLPLSVLNVEHFPIHQQWYAIFPKEKVLSTIARAFMELLIKASPQFCQIYF